MMLTTSAQRPAMLSLLLLLLTLVASLCMPADAGSRFTFSLPNRAEECFLEDVDARASNNKILFRFGIIEPNSYDLMDVKIKTPSLKIVESWNRTQNDHVTSTVRESGLYQLCFTKRAGASKVIKVFYSFDFISTGSVSLTLYPNVAATVDKTDPGTPVYTSMKLSTVNGQARTMGIMDFDLHGVSPSIIRPSTRVQLLLATDSVSKEKMNIAISVVPRKLQYPLSWNALGSYVNGEYRDREHDSVMAELGSHIAFDITELFTKRLNGGDEALVFTLHTTEDGEATVWGMSYITPDHYPQIVVEDLGLELMHEVAYFKETVFGLRGDISYILHRERGSRNAAESANSRVKWLSLLINFVLIGIAFAQVLYIRSMLESSY